MKTVKMTLLATTMSFFFAMNSYALPTADDEVTLTDSFGSVNGGEFNVFVNDSTEVNYISFCLEKHEYVSMGTPYTISSVADYAENGGEGAVDDKDYVSDATKWVFWNYLFKGTFGDRSEELANNVQNTIWFLEEEITLAEMGDASATWYSTNVAVVTDYTISGTVKVLNLKDDNGIYKQSQLIGEVPEPSTMLLFGTGLAGLASFARRKR
ncbi:MAG: hypothetical protein CSB34_01800 [Desulfobulbus propionicus]|nr:MAG: hypothetical protein CSB34_01800 [Desulfobulbus propionicus]